MPSQRERLEVALRASNLEVPPSFVNQRAKMTPLSRPGRKEFLGVAFRNNLIIYNLVP